MLPCLFHHPQDFFAMPAGPWWRLSFLDAEQRAGCHMAHEGHEVRRSGLLCSSQSTSVGSAFYNPLKGFGAAVVGVEMLQ